MKIVKLENIQEVTINIDIQLVDNINETPVYWRVGDDNKSLLEFAILPSDGRVAAITLVAINPDFVQYVGNGFIASNKSKFGFPIVDMNQWKLSEGNNFSHRFIDEFNCVIKVKVYRKYIMLIIKDRYMLSSWVKCNNSLWFELDNSENIIIVLIKELSKEDVNNFFNAIS